MRGLLDEIRKRIGPPPRRIPPDQRHYLVTRPLFGMVASDDDLLEFYRNQELLLREGTVAWGATVQANSLLFGFGSCDLPATVIYSTDPAIEADPPRLAAIASNLFGLRNGRWDDPDQQKYGDMLEKETERAMGIPIPHANSEGLRICSTTAMIRRRHLPSGILLGSMYPVLTHANTTAIMIVPSRAWPDAFAASWRVPDEDGPEPTIMLSFDERVAGRLRDFASSMFSANDDWYVRLYTKEPTNGFDNLGVRFSLEHSMNPRRHFLVEAHGVKLIISRGQADLFSNFLYSLPPSSDTSDASNG